MYIESSQGEMHTDSKPPTLTCSAPSHNLWPIPTLSKDQVKQCRETVMREDLEKTPSRIFDSSAGSW